MMGMHVEDGPMPMSDWEKKQQMRNKAMKDRMGKLPQNPVVEKASKKLNKSINAQGNSDQWAPIDNLVSTAYSQFCDGELSFAAAATHLGEAISGLAKAKK